MLRSLEKRGLVRHERYGCVELTQEGAGFATRTESSRIVLSMFLTEILGIPEDVATEDACMIEHLVSPEVSIELLRLTTFMRSKHPAAAKFREAYRNSPRSCKDHAPGACDSCGATCLRDSLESPQSAARCPPSYEAPARAGPHAARTLDQLAAGERGVIASVDCPPSIARRLMELGVLPGTAVEVIRRAPLG